MRPKLGRIGPDVPTPRWDDADHCLVCRITRRWWAQRVVETWGSA